MAKLPSWSWISVGLLIAITSWYVELTLFFWLGWLLILIGAAKFVIALITQEKESPAEQKMLKQTMPPQRHEYYRCQCGNIVRKVDNFCSWCGRRLR